MITKRGVRARAQRCAVVAALLVAQLAALGHLAFAQHSVCSDSGQLVDGAEAPTPDLAPDVFRAGSTRSDEHCAVMDCTLAPAVAGRSESALTCPARDLGPIDGTRAAWSRAALVDAPKASPPRRG